MRHLQMFALALGATALLSGYALAKVVEINSDTEYKRLAESKNSVVMEFAADWCGVCGNIKEQFEQVAALDEFKSITFARVNIDKTPEASKKNGIIGVPSFLYLKNGEKKNESVGVRDINAFNETLAAEIRKTFNITQS